jgi:hypothetical protein
VPHEEPPYSAAQETPRLFLSRILLLETPGVKVRTTWLYNASLPEVELTRLLRVISAGVGGRRRGS